MTTAAQAIVPPSDEPQLLIAIRLRATVQPGHRIELTAPELPEGGTVDVIVVLPHIGTPSNEPPAVREKRHVLDIIRSLPTGPRSASTWEQVERRFREEREAWDKQR